MVTDGMDILISYIEDAFRHIKMQRKGKERFEELNDGNMKSKL